MHRLLFEKTGNAVWISHLDLMRLFQRAFKRAGMQLKHTQGYNPRPTVSIALPLSVGVQSKCELLDFELDEQVINCSEITERLNATLVDGIKVLGCYDTGRKLKELTHLRCDICLEYDNGVPDGTLDAINQLFSRDEVIVPKKSKNGVQDQNIIPMIQEFTLNQENAHILHIEAIICCQNPALNPMQMTAAIERYIPQCKPDFASYIRLELLDTDKNVFR